MRLRHIKNSEIDIYKSSYVIKDYEKYKGKFYKFFGNKNNIELEIGMGKGDFLISKAIDNPNINYIGVEKYASVLLKAVEKLENLQLNNIKLLLIDAINIDNVFNKEISILYLNFSDPWPKNKHENRRLTSKDFLEKFETIFKKDKIIEMKTDNLDLFNYSVKSFLKNGYNILEIDNDIDSVYKTEYEKKFKEKGNKINYVKSCK